MSRKEIEITIDEEGNGSIEAFGFTDGSCKAATKELEEAFGTVQKRKMKDHKVDVKQKVKAK